MRATVLYIEGVERLNIRTAPPRMQTGEVSFRNQQRLPVRPVEIGAVDRAAEVNNEHSTAFQVQSQADAFPSNG
jgi:hypothetical protein